MDIDEKKHQAALAVARDLSLKMVEQRLIGPDQLPEALTLFTASAKNALAALPDDREVLLLKAARELTGRMIERGLAGTPQAVAKLMNENFQAVLSAVQGLPLDKSTAQALAIAKDLTMKLFEINRLSPAKTGETLAALTNAALAADRLGRE